MFDFKGYGGLLIEGALITLALIPPSLALGLLLGMAGALAKSSRSRVLRGIGQAYTTIIRGIPELLVVLFVFFALPVLVNNLLAMTGSDAQVTIGPFVAGVTALGLAYGAYATEVFRGALGALPKGQIEAARALGMSPALAFRRIVLPQVWRLALPGLGNLLLVMMKDTSLVSVVALDELMRKAHVAAGATREPFTFFFAAALIYLFFTLIAEIGIARLEYWAARGTGRRPGGVPKAGRA
ncbi:ABC transporter permease subunit [Tistrella bauzanensis]|uniref:ABC transporter permease n=1 Tax=Tistrella TaxID=171436 RepID=UPI0031F71E06